MLTPRQSCHAKHSHAFCPQVETLTAQVSDLEEAIQEATQQSTMAAQQLQQVGDVGERDLQHVWVACATMIGAWVVCGVQVDVGVVVEVLVLCMVLGCPL